MDDWKTIVRIGGLSGIISGIFLLVALQRFSANRVLLTDTKEELLVWLGRNRSEFVITYSLVLSAALLAVPLLLALYRVLREKSPGFALVGAVSGVIAFTIFAVFVSLLLGTSLSMAEIFWRTPPADQRVVLMVAEALGEHGLILWLVPLALVYATGAFLLLGLAILIRTVLPKWSGWLSIILGVAIPTQLLVQSFLLTLLIVPLEAAWSLLLGVKVFRAPISEEKERKSTSPGGNTLSTSHSP